MADLFNQQISATYSGLLKTTSNGILSSSLAQITDGRGNGSQLYLSTSKINFYNAYEFPTSDGLANQVLKTDGSGVLTWEDDANTGGVTKTGTIALNTIAVWNDNADQLRSDTTMSINTNHTISLLQPNSVPTDVSSYNIGGGNIANVTGQNNTGFGQANMQRVTTGSNNVAFGAIVLDQLTIGSNNVGLGKGSLFSCTEGDANTGVGAGSLADVTTGDNNTALGEGTGADITTTSGNTFIGKDSGRQGTGSNNTYVGFNSGSSLVGGDNNVIIGSNTGSTISTTSNNIIISDGSGNNRIQVDSGGNVGIGTSTIESYWSGYTALKVGYNNSIFGNTADSVGSAFFISQNLYNDGGNYRYVGSGSDEGGLIDLRGGAFVFSNAPLGTAGNIASIVPRLTISSGGAATFAGIVGINGSTTANIPLTATTSSGYEDVAYFKSAGTNIKARINLIPTGTGDGVVNATANDLVLQTSGTDRLTITSGGNVGIGTDSPTSYTGYSTLGLNGTNGGVLEFKKGDVQMARIANAGDPKLQFVTNGLERVVINTDGILQAKYGIAFPNQSAGSGTVSSSTLDAYEEGTWTGTMLNTGTSPNPTATGTYTRVGDLVHVQIYFTGKTITSAGTARVSGLPFNATSSATLGYSILNYLHGDSISNCRGGYIYLDTVFNTINNSTPSATWVVGSDKNGMWSGTYKI